MSNLIILLGASGSGKSTLENGLKKLDPNRFDAVISATTRQPRQGEVNGVHYHFLTPEIFQEWQDQDLFAEWEQFGVDDNNNPIKYGTPATELQSPKDILLSMEPMGAAKLVKYLKANLNGVKPFIIYLDIPKEERRQNMENRGDSKEAIEKRMAVDNIEERFQNSKLTASLTITHLHPNLPTEVLGKLPS